MKKLKGIEIKEIGPTKIIFSEVQKILIKLQLIGT